MKGLINIRKFLVKHRYFSPRVTIMNTFFNQITQSLPDSKLLLFEVDPKNSRQWNANNVEPPTWTPVVSQCVSQAQIESPIYHNWCTAMHDMPRYSRKQWEYVYVLESLRQQGLLTAGRKGLGFAVGTEPISAVLATYDIQVLATDLPSNDARADDWKKTGQHADILQQLDARGICDPTNFARHVQFRPVNMTEIPANLYKQFDFVWSCCAFEHLGSLEAGLQFVTDSLQCLKPGGTAIHTTEYCVNSNDRTTTHSSTVLYRRQDLERLRDRLQLLGYKMDLNFHVGNDRWDHLVSLPPYHGSALKMYMSPFITTSIGLLIKS